MAQIVVTGISIFNSINGSEGSTSFRFEAPSSDADNPPAPPELHDELDRLWRALVAHQVSLPA